MADKSIMEVAKERFQRAKDANSTLEAQAIDDTRFVLGDSDNKWQWDNTIAEARERAAKPMLTINVTAQHCNQIENQIRQNRPTGKVLAVDSASDVKTAEILGGMLRSIQSYSNADTAHDIAAMHSIYGGIGYWRVLTDYESEKSFDQVICIKPLVNPRLVYIDDNSIEPDRSDAEWGFIFEDIPRQQAEDEHGDHNVSSWADDGDQGWVTKDTIRRAEYFWCDPERAQLLQLEDGSTVLDKELPETSKLYQNTIITGEGQSVLVINKRETFIKRWYWCKLLGGMDKPIDKKEWPGSYLPIITVVGKEVNINGEIVRKGIVRDLKDSGRMVNYSYSAAVETVALQNKVPYIASAEAVEGFEDLWGAANAENRAYLPYNSFDEQGNAIPIPQRQPSANMATAQVQMLQLSTEQMRGASGQQNANFGIKSEAQSGVGIQRLKAQGEIATFHFPDNLARALKYEAKVVLDLIPKIYDSARVVRILGLDGNEKKAKVDPSMSQPYAETEEEGVEAIFNPSVGRYDVMIDTGPSYQTQRQEAADAFTSLAAKSPALMERAGDLIIKSLDLPMSQEIGDRLKPQGLPGDEPGETEQLMQQLQQTTQESQMLKQLVEKMKEHVEELEAEKAGKIIEGKQRLIEAGMNDETKRAQQEDTHNINAYKAETDRLKALAGSMTPEALTPLIRQTIMEILSSPPLPEEADALRYPALPITPEMDATGAQPGLADGYPQEGTENV